MPSLDQGLAPRTEPKLAMRTNILVVEDESAIVELLRYNLEREGFA
jgi:hypothetical protein